MANLIVEFKGNGIAKIRSKQYSFHCFSIPRKSIASSIPDLKTKMAVYFLVDSKEGKREKRNLYVGETSNGMTRFFDHKKKKDWWDRVYLFTADKEVFDEGIILGLENLLIQKYKASDLYKMAQRGSKSEIDEDCECFAEQIISIMDFFGYSIEEDDTNDDDNVLELSINEANELAKKTSKIFCSFDKSIKALSPNFTSDQLKLYTAYKYENKNICAVWLRSYGVEVEFYTKLQKIKAQNTGAYDTSFRKRGKKECAVKIENQADIEKAMLIVKQIAEEYAGMPLADNEIR